MAVSFVAPAPSPAKVHDRAVTASRLTAAWIRIIYRGGFYSREHYRTCSWCGCIHPYDLVELLNGGGSALRRARPGKILLLTPNPIAGELIQMGSIPGPVFAKDGEPADLVSALMLAALPGIHPTVGERLAGHYERPCFEPAPDLILQPFYAEHATDAQWREIEPAAEGA